jgi:hypothetical protein
MFQLSVHQTYWPLLGGSCVTWVTYGPSLYKRQLARTLRSVAAAASSLKNTL